MDINQVLNLVCLSRAKEGRTPLLNANNLPGKDPAVGINGFEGVRPEWLLLKKESLLRFGKRAEFEGGGACPLNYLFFFLNFLSFLLYFLSYLFSFLFTLFFFFTL